MKILYLINIPAPYYVDFFNEMGKNCELTVLFELKNSSKKNLAWQKLDFKNFNGIFLKTIKTSHDKGLSLGTIKYILFSKWDFIILNNFSTPTGLVSIFILKLLRKKYILESYGGFPKSGFGIKEKAKFLLIKDAYAYLSAAKKTDEYFKLYGAKEEKIYRFYFSSLYQNEILIRPFNKNQKYEIKKKLRISTNRFALYVGDFNQNKNIFWLIKNWNNFDNRFDLVIIGDGLEKYMYKKFIQRNYIKNIHVLDFMPKEKVLMYFRAADLYVHPTLSDDWGLVINEALGSGLPVITTPHCIAGLELIQDYENGFVSFPDNDFINKIKYYSENYDKLDEHAINAISSIKEHSIENWTNSVLYVLSILINQKYIRKI